MGARASDKTITLQSGLIDLLQSGDTIMADREFNIQEDIAARGIRVNVPPFLGSVKQMPAAGVEKNRQIAELCIHVEHVIGQARRFDILNQVFPISMADLICKSPVCFHLTNFNEPLVE